MSAKVFEARITEILPRTHDVLSFRVAFSEGMCYRAGQFMSVTIGEKERELSKYLSFSSAPTEPGYLEFTKKISTSDFSQGLRRLRPGDAVRLKMPLGSFVLEETAPKHLFLSGGIGITPIRSIWKDAFDRDLHCDMRLLYSNKTPEDIAFKDDLEFMGRHGRNFRTVFSLDTADACPPDWRGRCGFISAAMIQDEVPDFFERVFYVCGPPAMVANLLSILQGQLKVPEKQIKRENFAGY
ncbi:MAG: FAD-dependent oxidoreductase [Candidatus Omnitrophica bacterium]|nr:FAD-dependent oxidoreductase [Candidatus Omnitrophota bacterium]